MRVDRVTLTGADDSVHPEELFTLSMEFPFVEWGLLISRAQEGSARFPSQEWFSNLQACALASPEAKFSCHVCGRWTGRLLNLAEKMSIREWPCPISFFGRIQLNFHAEKGYEVHPDLSKAIPGGKQVILQMDGVNDSLLHSVLNQGIDAVPLFDKSGGAGIVPPEWPEPMAPPSLYCGYAGGLGPENVEAELDRIALATRDDRRIWIDMERKLRSEDDQQFDMGKCRRVLEAVSRSRYLLTGAA
jgi:hypothetical protein